ncbi:major coat protein [Enterobacteria phage NL95]|nr:major coat protein [Enterobacteria phage NL95]
MAKLNKVTLTGIGKAGNQTLTLTPRGVNPTNGVASLSEAGAVPALEKRVTVSVAQPSRNRKNYKVQIKLQNPTACTKDACDPSVTRSGSRDVTLSFTSYSTERERALIRTELAALLKDDLIVDAIDNLNPAY